MDKRYAAGLAAGLASAVLALSVVTGSALSAFLAFASPLPLLIAGLGWGVKSVALGAGAGTVSVLVLTHPWGGIAYGVAVALPAAGFSHLALLARTAEPEGEKAPGVEWYPAGRLLAWLTAFAIGVTLAWHLALLGQGGLPGYLREAFRPVFEANSEVFTQRMAAEGMTAPTEQMLDLIAQMLPGAMASLWLLLMGLNALAAQRIVRLSGRAIRGDFRLAQMELPPAVAVALAVSLVLVVVPGTAGFMGATAAAVLIMPFFIMGLITVHVVTAGWGERSENPAAFAVARMLGLAALYFLILNPATSTMAIAVSILGLMDQWMNLRQRALAYAAKKESK